VQADETTAVQRSVRMEVMVARRAEVEGRLGTLR
jgi:hypothetical protein